MSAPEGAVLEKEMDRAALINVAYRLLGSIADAEDVAQETYLRWYKLTEGERDGIRTPGVGCPRRHPHLLGHLDVGAASA